MANYGEYSGAPTEQQTYEYAKTILSLMTREVHPDGNFVINKQFLLLFVQYIMHFCMPLFIFRKDFDHRWRNSQLHKRRCNLQRYRQSPVRVSTKTG